MPAPPHGLTYGTLLEIRKGLPLHKNAFNFGAELGRNTDGGGAGAALQRKRPVTVKTNFNWINNQLRSREAGGSPQAFDAPTT